MPADANDRPVRGRGRQALLEAVVRVVARSGFDALTYRAVAAEAGVTHGLVSYYFQDRETMIHEALAWAAGEAIRASSIGVEVDRLDEFAANLARLVADDPEGQAFQLQLKLEGLRRPAIGAEVRALRQHYLKAVEGALARAGLRDDPALARLVLAALDGLVLQQLIFRSPELTEDAVKRLTEVLALLREHRGGEPLASVAQVA